MTAEPIYDRIGEGYAVRRRPDPRIARLIDETLGDAQSVVNVGAGSGSYEPPGRRVLAVEPSEVMRRQRRPGAVPCVAGSAEDLPVDSASHDAAMAVLTLHHWRDLAAGLKELRRVARRRAVILTWVPDGPPFWLTRDYFPEVQALDREMFPTTQGLAALAEAHLGPAQIRPVPIPHDCIDGFQAAYWKRPHAYLDAGVRAAISSFSRIDAEPGLALLKADLQSGRWAARNAGLMALQEADFGYRLVCCELGG